ncbi:MAG: lamin tail domain-containing protein [Chloroflexota bacterium]
MWPRWSLSAALVCALFSHPASAQSTEPPSQPWLELPAGAFFSTGEDEAGAIGYAVLDEPGGAPFWTAFQTLGSVDGLGTPVSRPFGLPDARVYQAFARGLLRWTPGAPDAEIAELLNLLWAAGRDPWLNAHGVPPARRSTTQTDVPPLDRMAWLTDDGIRDAYYSASHPGTDSGLYAALLRYGLPASEPVARDDAVVQRFDRAVLVRDVATGVLSTLPVGVLLRDSGLLPAAVLAHDRTFGGQLVTRSPRVQVNWPNARGWVSAEPAVVSGSGATRPADTLAPPTLPAVPAPAPPAVAPAPATATPPHQSLTTPAATSPGSSRATPAGAPPQAGAVLLIKAVVNQGRAEHVVIANEGTSAQELTGWVIRSGTGGQLLPFPAGFVLAPGASVRLHSGTGASTQNHPPADLFATGANVWNNAGDTAILMDPSGRILHQLSYAG